MDIDLPPRDWKSERAKPREPLLGAGAGPFLVELVTIAAAFGIMLVVLLLAAPLADAARRTLFGEVAKPAYNWTPEKGIEPANQAAIEAEMKRRGLLK